MHYSFYLSLIALCSAAPLDNDYLLAQGSSIIKRGTQIDPPATDHEDCDDDPTTAPAPPSAPPVTDHEDCDDDPTPAPGTPAPGTPAPGTPAPGTPAPGTPAPGTPAPGTEDCTTFFDEETQENVTTCGFSYTPTEEDTAPGTRNEDQTPKKNKKKQRRRRRKQRKGKQPKRKGNRKGKQQKRRGNQQRRKGNQNGNTQNAETY